MAQQQSRHERNRPRTASTRGGYAGGRLAVILVMVVAVALVVWYFVAAGSQQASSASAPPPAARSTSVTGEAGTLTAGSSYLLPLSRSTGRDGSLAAYRGLVAQAQRMQVLSIPQPDGFWIGTSDVSRVFVKATGGAMPPIRPGDRVNFIGNVVPNPPGFAESVPEGADLLKAQTQHLEVYGGGVTIAG